MKNSKKYNKAFDYFKKEYAFKMGGKQKVILPNGKSKIFDDRKYYSGHGSRYNENIKHEDFVVKVTRKEYSEFLKNLKNKEIQEIEFKKKKSLVEKRILESKKNGVYSVLNNYIELSDEEIYGKFFDAKRLANTLKINIKDAELLKSKGKTYVFAKNDKGEVLELYHSSLDCNNLSIYFEVATEERIKEFNHKQWKNSPYSDLVGMTDNENHFVC